MPGSASTPSMAQSPCGRVTLVGKGRCVPYPAASLPGCCFDQEPVSGLGNCMVQVFLLGAEKKMVLIDSPSAATWTQFAAPGGGAGGSGAVGRN